MLDCIRLNIVHFCTIRHRGTIGSPKVNSLGSQSTTEIELVLKHNFSILKIVPPFEVGSKRDFISVSCVTRRSGTGIGSLNFVKELV